MSHYLKNLVRRSLGESGGLNPRPATRYESVRERAAVEFPESAQKPSFQDFLSRISPIETEAVHVESIIERGRQTDASLPSEPRRDEYGCELIRRTRQNQSGLFGEETDGEEIAKKTLGDPSRPLHEVSEEGAAKLVSHVPRPNTAVSDHHEASAAPIAESLPALHGGAIQPAAVESHPPSARLQDVPSDLIRPTLREVSFQPVRGEIIAPPHEARAPIVQIRIGRIEVRAVEPPVPAPSKKLVEPSRSSVSLDQYLSRRSPEA